MDQLKLYWEKFVAKFKELWAVKKWRYVIIAVGVVIFFLIATPGRSRHVNALAEKVGCKSSRCVADVERLTDTSNYLFFSVTKDKFLGNTCSIGFFFMVFTMDAK